MIANEAEYERACEELDKLQTWLEELRRAHPGHEKGLTKAGIRKMIARLQEDIGFYEGSREVEESPFPGRPEGAPLT
jgi:hypothetical protein